ncbi:MAG: bifunctional folylpolyglutamate synthase/dihydrofolate synthase [Spirochaetota bacterium]
MNTIDQALDYLYSFINYEVDSSFSYTALNYNVQRTLRLLHLLGDPHQYTKIIHVAGTKGKGSVCKMLSVLLNVQHYRTGLFTSPHIQKVNERIVVNENQIQDHEIVQLANMLEPLVNRFPIQDKPTTFELFTVMAMQYFKMKKVQYSILETGMGGRFDSTNFSDPELSIITSISYDHMDKLGTRIEDIAFEKAGIIKPGKPVVIGYQKLDVHNILTSRALQQHSPWYDASELCTYHITDISSSGARFDAEVYGTGYRDLFISLVGEHQVENAVSALLALKVLGLLPEEEKIKKALAGIDFPTRLELIEAQTRFLLDSAHNHDSSRALAAAVKKAYHFHRLISVVGIVKGKDVHGILKNIASISQKIIITEPVTHKQLDTEYVYRTACSIAPRVVLVRDIREAIQYAAALATDKDLVLITGSFYTTSPAREYIRGMIRGGAFSGSGKKE